mgnify:CR=1 FL=1
MKTKNIFKITPHLYMFIAAIGMIGLLGSCEDFLEEEDIRNVNLSYYETPEGFERGVNFGYHVFRRYYGNREGTMVTVMGTDIWVHGGDGGRTRFNDYTPDLDASDGYWKRHWNDLYQSINTINSVLAASSEVDMTQTKKDHLTGELHFLRGHHYYLLVRMFGGVPLNLEPTTGPVTEQYRASQEEVYEAIVNDLENAIPLLPDVAGNWGRATKGAAKHLAAEVYLTRGYITGDQADFERAAVLAEEVINSGQYSLLDNFKEIFLSDNERNDEVIFSIQWTKDPLFMSENNRIDWMFIPQYCKFSSGCARTIENGSPWTRHQPSRYLMEELFDPEIDQRYHGSFQTLWIADDSTTIPEENGEPIYSVGDTAIWIPNPRDKKLYNDRPYIVIHPDAPSSHGELFSGYLVDRGFMYPALTKHRDFTRLHAKDSKGGKDFLLFRLGITHLIAAEAYYHQNDPDNAVAHLNVIRERAAYPGSEEAMKFTADQVDLDLIMDEWALETAGEMRRWFDLKRPGADFFVDRIKAHNSYAAPNVQEYHALRPIPQDQIDRVSNDFPQNPGY